MANFWDASPVAPQQAPAGGNFWDDSQDAEAALDGMSREEMISYYRTSKQGDPLAALIEKRLSAPMEGETPEQAEERAYGKGSDIISPNQALAAGWADTASGGFGDEIVGGIDALTGGSYEEGRDKARKVVQYADQYQPVDAAAGRLAGGVTQGLIMGPGAVATSIPKRMAIGAGLGAGQGAVYGAGSADGDIEDRLEGAAKDGALGAGIGLALPGVTGLIGKGYTAAKTALANRGIDAKSLSRVADMLESSGATPADAKAAATRQGPEGMLADVNPGMQVEAGGTSVSDSGAASLMAGRTAARTKGQTDRVGGALDDALGPYVGPQRMADALTDARKPAGPAYELAKEHVVDAEPVVAKIDELLDTFGPKSDLGRALTSYREQMIQPNGRVIERGHMVHGIREQLDDAIDSAFRSGHGKMGGRLKEVRREVDEVLKTQVPGFEEADALWTATKRIEKGYEYGKEKLLGNIHPDQNDATIGKMLPGERKATAMGLRDELEMRMANARNNPAGGTDRVLQRNMNDQKVSRLIEDPTKGAKLRDTLDNEMTFLETDNLVNPSRGSRTATIGEAAGRRWGGRGAGRSATTEIGAGAAAGSIVGGPAGAAVGAAAGLGSVVRDKVASILGSTSPKLIRATADKLTRQGPQRDMLIDRIIADAPRRLGRVEAGKQLDKVLRVMLQGQSGLAASTITSAQERNRRRD
jgi:hypothetical protein